MTDAYTRDPFAHLKQHASERADRTVERLQAGITALRSAGRNITAESIRQMTRELEPGFAGLSFQVIRRNARAYVLYRDAATAFTSEAASAGRRKARGRRRARRGAGRNPPATYDPLQRLDKRELVQRVRALEQELRAECERRSTIAYDQQVLLGKILRLETEIVLLQADRSSPT
jgi:hypothetical protein